MTEVVTLANASGGDVARVLTDAFLDDPGWRDVGPGRERHQRSGMGRALMARVLADADDAALPIYLETAKAENLPYYRSFGFVGLRDRSHPRRTTRGRRGCVGDATRACVPFLRAAGLMAGADLS